MGEKWGDEMDGIWVCKPDGTIQCQNEPEITLAEARNRLALLVGEQNILEEKKHYIIVIWMCGRAAEFTRCSRDIFTCRHDTFLYSTISWDLPPSPTRQFGPLDIPAKHVKDV